MTNEKFRLLCWMNSKSGIKRAGSPRGVRPRPCAANDAKRREEPYVAALARHERIDDSLHDQWAVCADGGEFARKQVADAKIQSSTGS
jgi:hypothetical protein